MDHKLIVANWKSHKTVEEGALWLEELAKSLSSVDFSSKTLVVCPSFTSLALYVPLITNLKLPVILGAQTVSSYEEGAYTGEVSARQIQELVEYVIIGHSERRTLLHETDNAIEAKVGLAQKYELKSIVCIQDETTLIPQGTTIVAYEPPAAIGTGNVAAIDDIERVARAVTEKNPDIKFLYGGSVTDENIQHFIQQPFIDGILVGSASLDIKRFLTLLQQW